MSQWAIYDFNNTNDGVYAVGQPAYNAPIDGFYGFLMQFSVSNAEQYIWWKTQLAWVNWKGPMWHRSKTSEESEWTEWYVMEP